MSAGDLGIVFGPTIMREETISVDGIIKIGSQYQIIETMILEYDKIFATSSIDDGSGGSWM